MDAGVRGEMRISPDGKRIAFFTLQEISEFWAMENVIPRMK